MDDFCGALVVDLGFPLPGQSSRKVVKLTLATSVTRTQAEEIKEAWLVENRRLMDFYGGCFRWIPHAEILSW